MRDGRLPDVPALARHIHEIRAGATLRGVEATVEGSLAADGESLVLRREGDGEPLRLAPLSRKVQWDAALGRDQAPTDGERAAFGRLESGWRGKPARVRITGPLRQEVSGGPRTLEVRGFVLRG